MTYVECTTPTCGNPVFATGLCRKHYDKARLETASPCSVSACTARAFRGGLCEPHYRAERMRLRPVCSVPSCGAPQRNLTMALCQKHEFRMRNHASVAMPREADWGAREAHPLYGTWGYHRRLGNGIDACWKDDFWAFVAAVGDRPHAHTLRKLDAGKPLGPNNWVWKAPYEKAANTREYAKQWRKHNPDKAKNANLKRHFGIGLAEYESMGAAQQWKCAICGRAESTKDRDGGPREMPVDHDHRTGRVRALLCTQCNRGLGLFGEDEARLQAAAQYLAHHKKAG